MSLDDCARFSGVMDKALEASNLINESYVLEISSPGIGNRLNTDRDFLTFRGFPIKVSFCGDDGSELHQDGLLQERSKDHLLVNIRGRLKKIPRASVLSVNLTSPTG